MDRDHLALTMRAFASKEAIKSRKAVIEFLNSVGSGETNEKHPVKIIRIEELFVEIERLKREIFELEVRNRILEQEKHSSLNDLKIKTSAFEPMQHNIFADLDVKESFISECNLSLIESLDKNPQSLINNNLEYDNKKLNEKVLDLMTELDRVKNATFNSFSQAPIRMDDDEEKVTLKTQIEKLKRDNEQLLLRVRKYSHKDVI
jgi:hypothetical protein